MIKTIPVIKYWQRLLPSLMTVVLLWGGGVVTGQELEPRPRPKIGLALGGGSSWGFAHIGVLRWFEEHRIPIDYLAGTSMGGLIGGAYATGMSADEIQRMISGFDWDQAFAGRAPYAAKNFRRKEDRRAFPVNFEIGLRGGLKSPAGLDPVHPVGLLLSRIAYPYSSLPNFDQLPIPYRCVATDMEKAEAVVLGDGSLAVAMRATMAIPGVFTPVERDGRILADGGMINNVPADVVKAMGAEIVIAVDVGTELEDRAKFQSVTGMAAQAISVMIYHRSRQVVQLADLVIAPEIAALPSKDFRESVAIAAQGYKAAAARARVLEKFSLDEAEWQRHLAARAQRRRTREPVPEFVELQVGGAPPAPDGRLKLEIPTHRPVDLPGLERQLTRVTGEGRYESLLYELKKRDEREGLLIRANEKSYGPPFVNFGFDINNARFGNADVNFATRLTFMNVGHPQAEARLDLGIGTLAQVAAEYYRPLGRTKLFVAPRAFHERTTRDLFAGESKIAEYRVRQAGAGADLGYQLGLSNEFRFGLQVSRINARVRIGDPLLPGILDTAQFLRFRYAHDSLNNGVVPTHGLTLTSDVRWYYRSPTGAASSTRQTTGELRLGAFRELTARNVGFLLFSGGTALQPDPTGLFQFSLGGPLRMGAFHQGELVGRHYFYLSPGFMRRIGRLPDFVGGKIYAGAWIENGSAFQQFNRISYRSDLSSGLVMDTRFGPVFIGGSWSEGGRAKIYFAIGRLFR